MGKKQRKLLAAKARQRPGPSQGDKKPQLKLGVKHTNVKVKGKQSPQGHGWKKKRKGAMAASDSRMCKPATRTSQEQSLEEEEEEEDLSSSGDEDSEGEEGGKEEEQQEKGTEGGKRKTGNGSKGVGAYGFSIGQRILLVGEGDFSFSRALASELGSGKNLVATAYDSQEVVLQKYKGAEATMAELLAFEAQVLFGVDATRLQACLHVGKKKRKAGQRSVLDEPFDRIVFNFPHVGLGIKDEAVNIQKNRELIFGFFQSAIPLLSPHGHILVTLKTGPPYQRWNAPGLAQQTGGLSLLATRAFHPRDFPGYHHRRTLGFIEGLSAEKNEEIEGQSRTYIFQRK